MAKGGTLVRQTKTQALAASSRTCLASSFFFLNRARMTVEPIELSSKSDVPVSMCIACRDVNCTFDFPDSGLLCLSKSSSSALSISDSGNEV